MAQKMADVITKGAVDPCERKAPGAACMVPDDGKKGAAGSCRFQAFHYPSEDEVDAAIPGSEMESGNAAPAEKNASAATAQDNAATTHGSGAGTMAQHH